MRSHPPGCRWFNGRPARQGARDLSLTVEKPGFLSLAALPQASALGISLCGPDQHLWWPQVSELRCNQVPETVILQSAPAERHNLQSVSRT